MNHGHSYLYNTLKPTTFRVSGLVPKSLEDVVGFIPLSGIEQLDPLSKAGVVKGIHELSLRCLLSGQFAQAD